MNSSVFSDCWWLDWFGMVVGSLDYRYKLTHIRKCLAVVLYLGQLP